MHRSHFDDAYVHNYSRHIRRVIPDYEHMVSAIAGVCEHCPNRAPRVVELGCGNGAVIESLFAAGAARVIGVDYSDAILEHASARFRDRDEHSFTAVKGDINEAATWSAPALREPADIIIASLIFHDIEGDMRGEFFTRVAAALRSDGLFCFADPIDRGSGVDEQVAAWLAASELDSTEIERLREDDSAMFRPIRRSRLHELARGAGLDYVGELWSRFHFTVELFAKRNGPEAG